jgi:hypothetical protein
MDPISSLLITCKKWEPQALLENHIITITDHSKLNMILGLHQLVQYEPIFGGVSTGSGMPLVDCGADGRAGRNPGAIAGRQRCLRAPSPSWRCCLGPSIHLLPSNRGNHRPLGQAVAAFLGRLLHGGTVRVARGVPCRLSESRLAATWSVGVLGAMYTDIDTSWTTLSSGSSLVLQFTRRL